MKKETLKKINKISTRLFIIVVIIFSIFLIYSTGRYKGIMEGMSLIQDMNNETMCDLINKTRDTDGFCILAEGKYNQHLDCGWEKFRVVGDKELPLLLNVAGRIKRIIIYPLIGCW